MDDTEDDEFDVDDAPEQYSEKPKGKNKLLLTVLPLLLLLGGGAGVYFSGLLDNFNMVGSQSDKPAAAPPSAKSVYFDLPDMLVNLNVAPSKPHYLKLKASLEVGSDLDITVLRPLEPRIIDKVQVYMRELRLEDLRAGGGLHGLREELLARINDAVKPVKVKNVLFRNFLIQ